MNEFDICWTRGDTFAEVTAPNASAMKSNLLELASQKPDEVKILHTNADGSILATVPVRYVKVRPPRMVTEEQAQAAAERFRQIREGKQEGSDGC